MERILDKILCFMWGHQDEKKISWSTIIASKHGRCRSPLGFAFVCKHCGAHKND